MQTFDLPPQISYSEPATFYFGEAVCKVTSNDLVVGTQVLVSVNVSLPTSMVNKVFVIDVKIDDAMMYDPYLWQNDIPYPSEIFMFAHNNSGAGAQTVIF